jgi:CRP-like cAMP-binding protein
MGGIEFVMSGKAVLGGDLGFISLADCFQILGGNNSTGTLEITSPYLSSPGRIYFVDGSPINGENGSAVGMDAIYSLFGWLDGKFDFFAGQVRVDRVVDHSRMEIVLDALRMLDDGLIQKVGPANGEAMAVLGYDPAVPGRRGSLPVIKGPLVDYMHVIDEEGFRDGVEIVTQGGHGNWIWVILEGTVRMTRATEKGILDVARLGEGCFIGTLTSFLRRDYVRSSTATAEGDVQLGVLDTQRLHREYASLSPEFRDLIPSMDIRLKKAADRAVEVFEGKGSVPSPLCEGERMIMEQGTSGRNAYCIKEGEARLVRKTSDGYLPLLTLSEGEFFGNVPFLNTGLEPRNASVVGSENLETTTVAVESLQYEYENLSGTFKNLIDNTCICVAITSRLITSGESTRRREGSPA